MTYSGVVELAGKLITFGEPTGGQMEMLAKIRRSISRGADDAPGDFWAKQIGRLGDLLDALMSETDQEVVEDLMIAGKVSSADLLSALFESIRLRGEARAALPDEVSASKNGSVASPNRARRG